METLHINEQTDKEEAYILGFKAPTHESHATYISDHIPYLVEQPLFSLWKLKIRLRNVVLGCTVIADMFRPSSGW